MSIHNIFSWPISTFLRFSQIRKPVLDRLYRTNWLVVVMGHRVEVVEIGNWKWRTASRLSFHFATSHAFDKNIGSGQSHLDWEIHYTFDADLHMSHQIFHFQNWALDTGSFHRVSSSRETVNSIMWKCPRGIMKETCVPDPRPSRQNNK